MTSRWLVAAARQRAFQIRWRTFSLSLLNENKPLPPFLDTPEFRARLDLAARALRVVQAAVLRGDNDAAGRFYAEWGARFHEEGQEPTGQLLSEVAAAAGVSDLLAEVDGRDLEEAVAESLAEALALAGPDVGSPVVHVDGAARGTFGPIVSPPPDGEEAASLWDAVVTMQRSSSFYELKRGRSGPPVFRAN